MNLLCSGKAVFDTSIAKAAFLVKKADGFFMIYFL